MLGRQLGQGLGLEGAERGDGLIALGQALPEGVVLVLEACDLGEAVVGDLAGLALGLQAGLELLPQVGVWAWGAPRFPDSSLLAYFMRRAVGSGTRRRPR